MKHRIGIFFIVSLSLTVAAQQSQERYAELLKSFEQQVFTGDPNFDEFSPAEKIFVVFRYNYNDDSPIKSVISFGSDHLITITETRADQSERVLEGDYMRNHNAFSIRADQSAGQKIRPVVYNLLLTKNGNYYYFVDVSNSQKWFAASDLTSGAVPSVVLASTEKPARETSLTEVSANNAIEASQGVTSSQKTQEPLDLKQLAERNKKILAQKEAATNTATTAKTSGLKQEKSANKKVAAQKAKQEAKAQKAKEEAKKQTELEALAKRNKELLAQKEAAESAKKDTQKSADKAAEQVKKIAEQQAKQEAKAQKVQEKAKQKSELAQLAERNKRVLAQEQKEQKEAPKAKRKKEVQVNDKSKELTSTEQAQIAAELQRIKEEKIKVLEEKERILNEKQKLLQEKEEALQERLKKTQR